MTTRLPTLLVIATLAACAAPSPLTGRWIGQLTPTTPGPTCIASRGLLQLTSGNVTFAPNEGTQILRGEAKPDGSLYADLTLTGANKQPYELTFEARWTPTTITGTYTTPRCSFSVTLSQPAT